MAKRRMFSLEVVDTDIFIDMPQSSRLLYYDLGMRADDDGFVKDPKKIIRFTGSGIDDLNLLIAKRFVIPFDSGVCVITHWKINNYLRNDRYTQTQYIYEKQQLTMLENGEYTRVCEAGIPPGIPTVSTGKDRLGKDRIDNNILPPAEPSEKKTLTKHKYGEYKNVLLTDDELGKLKNKFTDWQTKIESLSLGIALKGYKYKSHYLAILKWAKNEKSTVSVKSEADYTDLRRYENDGW